MLPDYWLTPLTLILSLLPAVLMLLCAGLAGWFGKRMSTCWPWLKTISLAASVLAAFNLLLQCWSGAGADPTLNSCRPLLPGLCGSLSVAWVSLLVQALGSVIISFSARYLEGEPRQGRYAMALCGVLTAVHLLLLADHWAILIIAWASVGLALHPLLCCYEDRPFAALAAHKKFLADRLADLLLIAAAVFAMQASGSGSQAVQNGACQIIQTSAAPHALRLLGRGVQQPRQGAQGHASG